MTVTALSIASRFIGLHEVEGAVDSPAILAMLQLDQAWPSHDEVPWCSAFVNLVCHLLGLQRSRSLAARSWLNVGEEIPLDEAQTGFDVVVLSRGLNPAQGHVGFFAGMEPTGYVRVLGGNQRNRVEVGLFPRERVVGVRRLRPDTPDDETEKG